jgi:hypothetical protein
MSQCQGSLLSTVVVKKFHRKKRFSSLFHAILILYYIIWTGHRLFSNIMVDYYFLHAAFQANFSAEKKKGKINLKELHISPCRLISEQDRDE